MLSEDIGPEDNGGSRLMRILRRCNDFRSQPAAVLTVATMAVFADTVAYGLIVPFLPEVLQDRLGMSSSANGILFGCFGVGIIIGAPVSAYASDRWKIRRWPMVFGLLGLGVTTILFALSNAFWQLVVARLAQGVSSGITWSIGLGMIAEVYPGKAMGQAMGVAFAGFTLGYLGGPLIGGGLYAAGGIHAVAIFVGALTFVDLVFRLLLVEPKPAQLRPASVATLGSNQDEKRDLEAPDEPYPDAPPTPSPPALGENADLECATPTGTPAPHNDDQLASAPLKPRTTMLDLLKQWQILACCLANIIITSAPGAFEPLLPLHMRESFGSTSVISGVVFAALVIPSVIAGPIAGRLSDDERILAKIAPFGRFGFMSVGALVLAGTIACVGATKNIAGLAVNLAFVGFVAAFAGVPIMSAMGAHVERMGGDAYAMVYALFNIAYSIGVIIVPTVMPPIMNATSFAATLGIVSAMLVVGAAILAIGPTSMLLKNGRAAYVGENALPFL
ncbi:hypothetical protein H4R19_000466 [Coemansia spiralis]|nr:hypothetical protein H4R19_000466 [Coemansia spiralis]